MADDITLTVSVRDHASGDFRRLDRQLDRLRRSVRSVGNASAGSSQQFQRLNQSLGDVQTRMQRVASTGRTTGRELSHMRHNLQLANRQLVIAARSGSITRQEFTHLRDQLDRTRVTFDDLSNTFRTYGSTAQRTGNSVASSGSSFGKFRRMAIGAAVALGASLLPTIGALAPMIAGIGSIAGVAALAFMGLDKPTKFLTKDQKDFLKAIKPVTAEFKRLQETARKSVLPKFVESADDMKKAVSALDPVLKIAGDSFGNLVGKIARGVGSEKFMKPFTENVKMGTKWVEQFAASFGEFTVKFFEFGTKSQPALDAWQSLLGGFLDTGLPGMFKGLEQGIKGSSQWLMALADFINGSLLPALGKVTGSFMEAFGPLLSELLNTAGLALDGFAALFEGAMEVLEPSAFIAADALKAFNEVVSISFSVVGSLAKALGGALAGALADLIGQGAAFDSLKGGFKGFSDFVGDHQAQIRGFFTGIALGIIGMVETAVAAMPTIIGLFKSFTEIVLGAFFGILVGAEGAFGWLPGMGDKLKGAREKFAEFSVDVIEGLDKAQGKAKEFSDAFKARTERAKLVLEVDQAEASLESIKEKLKDPELTKERTAKLTADKEEAERKLAAARGKLAEFDKRKAEATLGANPASFYAAMSRANRSKLNKKLAMFGANPALFWAAVAAINGSTVGTAYVDIQPRGYHVAKGALSGRAHGGLARGYADGGNVQSYPFGGLVRGPGTEMSDSIVTMLASGNVVRTSDSEFIVNAQQTRKYRGLLEAINDDRLPRFRKGGKVSKAEKRRRERIKRQRENERDARREAIPDLTISHFGRMAGFKNDEFRTALAKPDSLKGLVDSLNKWRSIIKKATHGGVEKNLLKRLDSAGRALIKYEKRHEKVSKELDKAKDKLSGLKESAKQLRDSVKQGLIGEANITRAAGAEDSRVTINTILSQMTASAANTKQFSGMLSELRKRGLSKDLIAQIAEAGIEGGGMETAAAILGGGKNEIKRLNELQKQITANAAKAGKTAADAMYAAGIKAAQGLVDGLLKKKKAIEKAMMNIAKAMEKAIKKALKIKSPSKVMMDVGHNTAEGFALGMMNNSKPRHAWDSMLNVPGSSGRAGSGSSVSGQPIVVHLSLGGKNLGEVIIDPLRKAISHRGGNVQATLGS